MSPPRKSPPTQPDWVVQARFSSRLSWLPHEILTQDVVFVLLVSTMNVRGIAVSGDCLSRERVFQMYAVNHVRHQPCSTTTASKTSLALQPGLVPPHATRHCRIFSPRHQSSSSCGPPSTTIRCLSYSMFISELQISLEVVRHPIGQFASDPTHYGHIFARAICTTAVPPPFSGNGNFQCAENL
jgi:hypothetical protein